MFSKLIVIVVCAFAAFLTQGTEGQPTEGCYDEPEFEFPLMGSDGTTADCGWLTQNESSTINQQNQATYCAEEDVKEECRLTCNNCPTTGCEDDDTYKFAMIHYPKRTRKCQWIGKNPDRTEIRVANYCDDVGVGDACKATCGKC